MSVSHWFMSSVVRGILKWVRILLSSSRMVGEVMSCSFPEIQWCRIFSEGPFQCMPEMNMLVSRTIFML